MVKGKSFSELLWLCERFLKVDLLRTDIDQRIMALPPNDPVRALLWQELEGVLVRLGDMFNELTHCPAVTMTELRAKAAVLAVMRQFASSTGGLVMPEEQIAFALSLADNTLNLPD